jgi:hypothetical protein
MIRSQFASAAALAAFLAVPAFAQMSGSASGNTTTTTTTQPSTSATASGSISATAPVPVAPSSTSTTSSMPSSTSSASTPSSTTQYNTNAQNPASKARQDAIDQGRMPLCSELGNNPNAGKLADQTTGNAAANSASPVHMDCIPDNVSSTTGANANGTVAANTAKAKKKPAKTASSSQ